VRSPAVRLWLWFAASLVAAAAVLAVVPIAPPRAPVAWRLALPAGLLAGIGVFAVVAWRWLPLRVPERARRALVAAKVVYVGATSATEEVFWRWLMLGGLADMLGLAAAFVVSTLSFAFAHATRVRSQAFAIHVATGATFGGVYVATGSLAAAIAAHATYNLLVLMGLEAQRPRSAVAPAIVGPRARVTWPAPVHGAGGAQPAAVLRDVYKRFRATDALRGFSLAVWPGEVIALLGPNGAGKTTALGVLLGLRRPERGDALLFGRNPREPRARRALGVTPQDTGFPGTLKVREVVELVRAHYAEPLLTEALLERFGLAGLGARQTGGLSGGQKRRLAVALAFAGKPKAVFLDEPTTGLDVESRRRVWEAIRAYAADGGTVLLTTHYLDEAEALASRVVVISGGREIVSGTVDEIRGRAGLKRVRVQADVPPGLPGVRRTTREGHTRTLYTDDPESVVRALVERGISLEGLEVLPASLEEAFLTLTREES
jgi:ABC-2 type transport system ATP-binding protein